ncbi:uromodulin-like [Hemitrygon akajei]|uniref:uromodulin-like n=1 Tax=Hemitrygon akajei TaxID=2704970 RepID=UPI003BFA2B3F
MDDGNLEVGWYRFNSSGGWKIPETVVPQGRCSGENPGWLNGPHPNVGEGEVTRTVCFTQAQASCYYSQEIQVKNCSGYFVYRLWPTPSYWSYAVYCTDPSNSKGTSQKPSSGPEEETCSVKGLPSKDECEEMINSAQVFIIGKNNLGNPEEQEAYLRQVREMLIEQLPCKHVLSKSEHDNGGGK